MTLTDQRIVIIGGSSGMGLATARAGAAAGPAATIAAGGRGRLKAALAGWPGNCDGAVADIRSEADVAALFAGIGEADQIPSTHLYLMENRFVTGTVLTVDGGFLLTETDPKIGPWPGARQRTLAIECRPGACWCGMRQAAWLFPVPRGSGSGGRQRVTSKPSALSLPTWWAICRRVLAWCS